MRVHHQLHQNQNDESHPKISRSKSRSQISAKLKQKESGWNDRFYLNHIPEYQYQNQSQGQYIKNKFRLPHKKSDIYHKRSNIDHSIGKSIEDKKLGTFSNKQNHRKYEEKSKEALLRAFNDLKGLWEEKSIPECHMEAKTKIFNREYNPKKILEDLKHQYSEISKDSSLIQKVVQAISSREICVQNLKEIVEKYQESQNKQQICKEFEEKISHLRILTIHCVQMIFQWKQAVESIAPRDFKVFYLHEGIPYTKKIKEDYFLIVQSPIKKDYSFQKAKIDTFFLNYSRNGKKISNISKNLLKRVRTCENMLKQSEISTSTLQLNQKKRVLDRNKSNISISSSNHLPPLSKRKQTVPDHSIPMIASKKYLTPHWQKVEVEYSNFNDYYSAMLRQNIFKDSFPHQIDMKKYQELTILREQPSGQEVILGIDRYATQRKIIILNVNIKVKKQGEGEGQGQDQDQGEGKGMEGVLKGLAEYLWENDYCGELRVSLMHRKVGEVYSVDMELQKKLKAVGFRWASVNNNNDIRMTIYSLRRPLNTIAHKKTKKTQTYPVIINHTVSLSLSQKFPPQSKTVTTENRCICSVNDLMRVLPEWGKDVYGEVKDRKGFSYHLESIEKVRRYLKKQAEKEGQEEAEEYFSYTGMKTFNIENPDMLSKIFMDLEIQKQRVSAPPAIVSILNSSFKFNHFTIQDANYTKFFPTSDNEILIVESNYPIYLLQTDEENINFFLIEVEEGFSMAQIGNIFTGMCMGKESSFIDEFWLPHFSKSEDYVDSNNLSCSEIISTNYENSLGSLVRKKTKSRRKIVKAPFVFGMINKKLLQILEIPFYSTLIKKQDLIVS